MDAEEVIRRAESILALSKHAHLRELHPHNFQDFSTLVVDVLRYELSNEQRAKLTWLKDWIDPFKAICDDYDRIRASDPMMLYKPLTLMHADYEDCVAFVRWLFAANGTGKTNLLYYVLRQRFTGKNRNGRSVERGNVALVSVGQSAYGETVFYKKFVEGDPHDPLTPIFPEGGKWFHSWHPRSMSIRVACPNCATAGRPKQCSHTLEIRCFSEESGVKKLAGPAYIEVGIDEPVKEEYFVEAAQRVRRGGLRGRVSMAATAIGGIKQWEYKRFFKLSPERNKMDAGDPNSPPYVAKFTISKRATGMYSEAELQAMRLEMSESEYAVRVEGKMVAIVDNPVFNYKKLDVLEKGVKQPLYGRLDSLIDILDDNGKPTGRRIPFDVENLEKPGNVEFTRLEVEKGTEMEWTGFRLWEAPRPKMQYIITADVSEDLSGGKGDASSASVYRLKAGYKSLIIEQVAQFYGWINPILLADELKKMGVWYNDAVIIPEVTGAGHQLVNRLVMQLVYANVFRDSTNPASVQQGMAPRLGHDTNRATKPAMIAAAQYMLDKDLLIVRSQTMLDEMRTYEREITAARNVTFAAGEGSYDDQVMDLCLVCYGVTTQGELLQSFMVNMAQDSFEKINDALQDQMEEQGLTGLDVPFKVENLDE